MTREELTPYIGVFGKLTTQSNGCKAEMHGKPKEIDDEDNMIFKDSHRCIRVFHISKIRSFVPKEMLPQPTEFKGTPVVYANGLWVNKKGKVVDIDR